MSVRTRLVNPVVTAVLRSPAHRILSRDLMLITYTGRRTGHHHCLPVMYADRDDRLVVVVGHHATKTWWRNFAGQPRTATVTLRGQELPTTGEVVNDIDEKAGARGAYQRKFRRVPLDGHEPVLLLTPHRRGLKDQR